MSHHRLPSATSSGASTPTNSSSRPAPPPPATQRPVPAVPGRPAGGPPSAPPGGPPPSAPSGTPPGGPLPGAPPGGPPPGPPAGAPPSRPPPGPPPSRPPPGPPPKVRDLPLQGSPLLVPRCPAGRPRDRLLRSPNADGPSKFGRQITKFSLQNLGKPPVPVTITNSVLTNVLCRTGLGYIGELDNRL